MRLKKRPDIKLLEIKLQAVLRLWSNLAKNKPNWIDFNAGVIAEGEPMEQVAKRFADYVIDVANGAKTNNEKNGYHEIAIFKNGVTL